MDRRDRIFFLRPGVLKPPEAPGKIERAKAALTSGLRRAAQSRDALSETAEASLAVLNTRLGETFSKTRTTAGDARMALSEWFNAALGTVEFGGRLNDWLGQTFASGKANAYDKAMDAAYNLGEIGGGANHRIFDGGHSCLGAWEACSQAARDNGDDFTAQVGGYLNAMWKDLVTPKGLPFATLDKESFEAVRDTLRDTFHIDASWLAGAVCVNASDLLGAATAVLSLALGWNRADVDKFSELAGSFGVSAGAAINPLLALVALVCLARAFQLAKGKRAKSRILAAGAKGGLGSAVFLGAMALLSAKVWVGLMIGVIASILARKAFEAGQRQIETIDWSEISAFIMGTLRRGLADPTAGIIPT